LDLMIALTQLFISLEAREGIVFFTRSGSTCLKDAIAKNIKINTLAILDAAFAMIGLVFLSLSNG